MLGDWIAVTSYFLFSPVTGQKVATMGCYGGYVSTSTENVEPLGQKIRPNDPADYSRRLTRR